MKVGLIAHGSRGDIQPFVVLARALERRGAEVELLGPPNLRALAEGAGVSFAAMPIDSHAFIASEEGQRLLARGDVLTFVDAVGTALLAEWDGFAELTAALASRSDVMVTNGLTFPHALSLVDPAVTPWALQLPFPAVPSGEIASPFVRGAPLPARWMNRLTHALAEHLYWRPHRAPSRAWRARRGLPPLGGRGQAIMREQQIPILAAWDPALWPLARDVHPSTHQTGDWCAPPDGGFDGALDPALDAWLSEGPKVVYVGFGSMPVASWPRLVEELSRVVDRLGLRALVVSGWSADASSSAAPGSAAVRVERAVDHAVVFPRCAAVVHHGGAGTTHASLRAGVPTVVCPLMIDQFFWAWRVEALGVGTSVRLTRLDEPALERAFRAVLRDDVSERAREIAAQMRSDGADRAADQILRLAERRT